MLDQEVNRFRVRLANLLRAHFQQFSHLSKLEKADQKASEIAAEYVDNNPLDRYLAGTHEPAVTVFMVVGTGRFVVKIRPKPVEPGLRVVAKIVPISKDCPRCSGGGEVFRHFGSGTEPCPACKGAGRVPRGTLV